MESEQKVHAEKLLVLLLCLFQHETKIVSDMGIYRVDHLCILVANQCCNDMRINTRPEFSRYKAMA
jgi:hypothetical protein